MGTIIQARQQSDEAHHQRWDRLERAARFDQYRERQAQGLSQRQAANKLDVPRSTLQAWQTYQESLDESPAVVAFFQSLPGLAFLGSVSNVEMVTPMTLIYKVLFSSISTFETPPHGGCTHSRVARAGPVGRV
jgi:FMN phosphatase YigB (HAD superfamily)